VALRIGRRQNQGVFGLGHGEVILLIVLAVIFLGPVELPPLWARFRNDDRSPDREQRAHTRESWSRSEWLLIGAVMVLGSLAIALTITGR
jgi:hypothetical protein